MNEGVRLASYLGSFEGMSEIELWMLLQFLEGSVRRLPYIMAASQLDVMICLQLLCAGVMILDVLPGARKWGSGISFTPKLECQTPNPRS